MIYRMSTGRLVTWLVSYDGDWRVEMSVICAIMCFLAEFLLALTFACMYVNDEPARSS